jgi:hypothetical protein
MVHDKWRNVNAGTSGEWCVMPRRDQRNLGWPNSPFSFGPHAITVTPELCRDGDLRRIGALRRSSAYHVRSGNGRVTMPTATRSTFSPSGLPFQIRGPASATVCCTGWQRHDPIAAPFG